MPGLSGKLLQDLRQTFSQCGPFSSNEELQAAFMDARISPWASRVSSAPNQISRINALINLLYNQFTTTRQNALALFIRVAAEAYPPDMDCHGQLTNLARRVEQETNSTPTSTTAAQSTSVTEQYTDFDLHMSPQGHTVATSEEGQAIAHISPEPPDHIRDLLNAIEGRSIPPALPRQMGQVLYDWLFPLDIHAHLQQTEAVARREGRHLRLRLRLEAEAVARLPLEFLYRRVGGYFLAVNPDTVLSRYLNLPLPAGYVRRRAGPLHLLAIIANPQDQATPLPADQWVPLLEEALAGPLARRQLTLTTVTQATRTAIRDALYTHKPDIIQVVGHGRYQARKGFLALVAEDSRDSWWVDEERLAGMLMGHDDHLGLISLATCSSAESDDPQGFVGLAPRLVERGIPAVVAMQYKVQVSTAKLFLEEFYSAVAARKPVDWATQTGRNAIAVVKGYGSREFATPVLYMRAPDGQVF